MNYGMNFMVYVIIIIIIFFITLNKKANVYIVFVIAILIHVPKLQFCVLNYYQFNNVFCNVVLYWNK